MKNALIAIVSAMLLACGSAAAASPDPCSPGKREIAAPHEEGASAHFLRSAADCARLTRAQFRQRGGRVLSGKEIERILKRKYPGEMNDMICNKPRGASGARCVEQRVQWKITRRNGKSDYCTLIVDAKTGTVLNELGKRCPRS